MNTSELEQEVDILKEQVNDLRWRMNAVCNFMSVHFRHLVSEDTLIYMVEEFPEKQSLAELHKNE
jgi:hypothetical protein